MPVKIRLQRHGSKKRPFYFLVAANATSPRDGKYIEKLGTYNPITVPAQIEINRDRATYWLQVGAVPTTTARRMLSFKGVLLWKHLLRGVAKGLFDQATAEKKYEEWEETHRSYIDKVKNEKVAAKQQARQAVEAQILQKAKAKQEVALAQLNEAPPVAEVLKEDVDAENTEP